MTQQGMPHGQPSMTRFVVRQKVTMMVNRYMIHALDDAGIEGPMVAVAQQKRMAFKEQVTFYSDEARTTPVFGFKARTRMDFAATYDVTDAQGQPIGWFKKQFGKSLLRSTWTLAVPQAGLEAVGAERNQTVAILRRFWGLAPYIGDIPLPWQFHFDFFTGDGIRVLSSNRRRKVRDQYEVELPAAPDGTHLDWRVGAAMAVALDALQSR
ncbi:hypothetical protein [Segeticoccus rhizosphaerae]|uniref:hypothetical protein n=1 Tax=Segeticoccus rhizosphaerae TaxID=1104777 RepID=UPI00192E6A56|nr:MULTISPECIES: hypothetical protein [Intrasporangiaceae]